jgi:putative NADH-flavin reductase
MARIVLVGASGNVGSRLLKELSNRGHQVTAIARNTEKIPAMPGVAAVKGDVQNGSGLAAILVGHDAVVSSVRFLDTDFDVFINAVRASGTKRFLIVGGAASLQVAPGKRLVDQRHFPAQYKPEALRGAAFLDLLKTVDDLDWTFLSPSAMFVPGERTGKFRLSKDELLTANGRSSISFEDYAIALVDEIENPKHPRQRFTVGY